MTDTTATVTESAKFFVTTEYEFEADSPEDAVRKMFELIESGDFDPTFEVLDAQRISLGTFDHDNTKLDDVGEGADSR